MRTRLRVARPGGRLRNRIVGTAAHVRTLLWVVADGARRFPWLAVGTVAGGVAGLALQVAAFAIVLWYAGAVEADRTVSLPGLSGPARGLTPLLWLVAGGAALCWLAGSAATYLAKVLPLRMRRAYQELCWSRAVPLLWRLPLPDAPTANRLVAQGMQATVVARGAQACSRLLANAMSALLPVGRLAVATVALLWIHWPITALLVALAVAGLAFQVRYNRAAGRASISMESHATPARRVLRGLLDGGALAARDPAALLRESEAAHLWNAKARRLELRERASLAMNVLGSAALLVVLAVLGSAAIGGRLEWTRTLLYVAVLRYFISNIGQLGALLTTAARFLPQATRYRAVVAEVEAAAGAAARRAPEAAPLHLAGLGAGKEEVRLAAGERCWVIARGFGVREIACRLQLHAVGSPLIAVVPAPHGGRTGSGAEGITAAAAAALVVDEPARACGGGAELPDAVTVSFLLCRGVPPGEAAPDEPALVADEDGGLRLSSVRSVHGHPEWFAPSPSGRGAGGGDFGDEDDEE